MNDGNSANQRHMRGTSATSIFMRDGATAARANKKTAPETGTVFEWLCVLSQRTGFRILIPTNRGNTGNAKFSSSTIVASRASRC